MEEINVEVDGLPIFPEGLIEAHKATIHLWNLHRTLEHPIRAWYWRRKIDRIESKMAMC